MGNDMIPLSLALVFSKLNTGKNYRVTGLRRDPIIFAIILPSKKNFKCIIVTGGGYGVANTS